jgi:hypothetical protein
VYTLLVAPEWPLSSYAREGIPRRSDWLDVCREK